MAKSKLTLLEKAKKATKNFVKNNDFNEVLNYYNGSEKEDKDLYPKTKTKMAEKIMKLLYPEETENPFGCNTDKVRELMSIVIAEEIPVPKRVKKDCDDRYFNFNFEEYQVFYMTKGKELVMYLKGESYEYCITSNHQVIMVEDSEIDETPGSFDACDSKVLPFRPATDVEIEKFIAEFTK